jgi:hypothetical protein
MVGIRQRRRPSADGRAGGRGDCLRGQFDHDLCHRQGRDDGVDLVDLVVVRSSLERISRALHRGGCGEQWQSPLRHLRDGLRCQQCVRTTTDSPVDTIDGYERGALHLQRHLHLGLGPHQRQHRRHGGAKGLGQQMGVGNNAADRDHHGVVGGLHQFGSDHNRTVVTVRHHQEDTAGPQHHMVETRLGARHQKVVQDRVRGRQFRELRRHSALVGGQFLEPRRFRQQTLRGGAPICRQRRRTCSCHTAFEHRSVHRHAAAWT